jgi:hypothetical protein
MVSVFIINKQIHTEQLKHGKNYKGDEDATVQIKFFPTIHILRKTYTGKSITFWCRWRYGGHYKLNLIDGRCALKQGLP